MPDSLGSVHQPLIDVRPAAPVKIEYVIQEHLPPQHLVTAHAQGPVHVFGKIDLGKRIVHRYFPPDGCDVARWPQVPSFLMLPLAVLDRMQHGSWMLAPERNLTGKTDTIDVRVISNGPDDFFNVMPADPVVVVDEDHEAAPGLLDQPVPLGSD